MSTSAFDANLHPRATSGRFTDRVMDEGALLDSSPTESTMSIEYTPSGTRIVTYRNLAGRPVNGPEGEPGMTEFDAAGRRISRTYYDGQGQMHNGPGGEPAMESYRADGSVIERTYAENGLIKDYADGSPGWASFYPSGSLASQGFYQDGKLDDPNDDTPAVMTYREDGSRESYTRYRSGVMHSEGWRPTQESYYPSGSVAERTFYTNGALHNRGEGQLGRVVYRSDRSVARAESYNRGELVSIRHFRG